jgi:hypothetical protein
LNYHILNNIEHSSKIISPQLTLSNETNNNVTFSNQLQRPNNLNLKMKNLTNDEIKLQKSDLSTLKPITPVGSLINENTSNKKSTAALMQSIALIYDNFNNSNNLNNSNGGISFTPNNNISLLMTPTLSLNTPTLFAITPLENTLNAFANTPLIQQNFNQTIEQINEQNNQTIKYLS